MSGNNIKVVLHADDLGMHLNTISAFRALYENHKIRSGSLMAPCPWFNLACELQKQYPQADLGLHLTLNSEWPNYRWGPIGCKGKHSSLLDNSGVYFHQTVPMVRKLAKAEEVRSELCAQIEFALNRGFTPSHLDCHMLCATQPEFLPITIDIALEYKIPLAITKAKLASLDNNEGHYWHNRLIAAGNPIFDVIQGLEIDASNGELTEQIGSIISQLAPGLYYIYTHPIDNLNDLDMKPVQAQNRLAEYQALMQSNIKLLQEKYKFEICTFGQLM